MTTTKQQQEEQVKKQFAEYIAEEETIDWTDFDWYSENWEKFKNIYGDDYVEVAVETLLEETDGVWIINIEGHLFVEEVECDSCEGKCRANETEECEDCGINLKIGCANKPSNHSIFDGCCDDCREEEMDECSMCDKETGIVWLEELIYCGDCACKKTGAIGIDMNGKFIYKQQQVELKVYNGVKLSKYHNGREVLSYPNACR